MNGDIVKVHYIGGNGVENDKVIFYRGTFCVDYSEDYKPLLNELNHCCEVIGNIYENNELLRGEYNDAFINFKKEDKQ